MSGRIIATTLKAGRPPVALRGEAPGVIEAHQLLFDGLRRRALQVEALYAVHAALCSDPAAKPGQIREGNVVVRLRDQVHYRPPDTSVVRAEMSVIASWLADALTSDEQMAFPVDLAADFHWRLCNVHPFQDGNGRVARAVATWIIATCGYGAVRPSILRRYLYARVVDYYDALRVNDQGDAGPWRRLFSNAVSTSLSVRTGQSELSPGSSCSSHQFIRVVDNAESLSVLTY